MIILYRLLTFLDRHDGSKGHQIWTGAAMYIARHFCSARRNKLHLKLFGYICPDPWEDIHVKRGLPPSKMTAETTSQDHWKA
ncbi:hypothetical protein BDV18DRAFT_144722 [Aspergillus unguis]